ncbi:MAG TPA: hypothetical protein VKA44_09345, partial [Gemmatimonadota bacterium]|nr:hypothetical protein [Gemmatimonadota bacterium]
PEEVSGERVVRILAFLRDRYDYVIIDTPKTFGPVAMAGIEQADELYLLTTADLQSLRNVARAAPLLKRVGQRKEDDWMRLVVNRYDSRQLITVDEVQKTLDMPVFATLANDYGGVIQSINEGRPIVLDGRSPFAQDVRRIAERITGVSVDTEQKGGWLSRMFDALRTGQEAAARNSTSNQVKTSG